MKKIIQYIENKGMPVLWQILIFFVAVITFITPLLCSNQNVVHGILMPESSTFDSF